MKRFNWKKILSLVLVLTLVVGTLTWNKRAASAEDVTVSTDRSTVSLTTDEGVTLTKKLLGIEMAENEPGFAYANIQLTVNGADATIGVPTIARTDVVFVMDLSSSMAYNTKGKSETDANKQRIKAAKDAAASFVKGILPAGITNEKDADVRVGIASFGKKGHQNLQLSYNQEAVLNAINKLSVGAGEGTSGTGTNLQAGIKAAKDILSGSNATNKIIVVLTDGMPTYSYKATEGNTEATTLTDGTSIKLLKTFDYNEQTIKGTGNTFVFDAYTVTNADSKKTGWYYAEDKGNHKKGDFYSNDNSKVTFVGTLKEGLTGTYKGRSNTYNVYFHIGATDNNGIPVLSEAKSSGAIIYSIAYDIEANLTNTDDSEERSDANYAKFVMTNLATSPSKYFAATSGQTTSTETAIKDVIKAITTSVDELVAAAKGTGVQDKFPSYMKAVEITSGNATIDPNSATAANGFGNEVDWNLTDDLRAGQDASIIIKAKIDLEAMAAAYAA